jgi:ubiquinone/menaquinone biosynthesis C-methylase UbiE
MVKDISRVYTSKEDAKKYYDHISGAYDWFGGIFERRPALKALNYLKIQNGENV